MADDSDQTFIFNRMGTYYKAGASPILSVELGLLPLDQFHSAAITTALQTLNGTTDAAGRLSGQQSGA